MKITHRLVEHKPDYWLATIEVDMGTEITTYKAEMKFHHILSCSYQRRTTDGLLLYAQLNISPNMQLQAELYEYYLKNVQG